MKRTNRKTVYFAFVKPIKLLNVCFSATLSGDPDDNLFPSMWSLQGRLPGSRERNTEREC